MNKQIVDYLQQNKINYSKEALTQQLRNSSYAENDIKEAVNIVFGTGLKINNNQIPSPIPNNIIISAQNNMEQMVYASLGKRILGGIIDLVILFIFFVISGVLFGATFGGSVSVEGFPSLVIFVLMLMYFIIMETLTGKTIGKYVVKTKVANEMGGHISWRQAVVRNLMRIVDAVSVLYVVGTIAIFLSSKKQRLGDMAAKTYVINE